jgi:hypothetical protein
VCSWLRSQCAQNFPQPFTFDPSMREFEQVKLSWVFLGGSLIMSLVVFPYFRFGPPRLYGAFLICYYVLFLSIAVLMETGEITLPF